MDTVRENKYNRFVNYANFTLPLLASLLVIVFEATVASNNQIAMQIIVYSSCVIILGYRLFMQRAIYANLGLVFLMASHLVWFAFPALVQAVTPELWFGDWLSYDIHISNASIQKATLLISLFFLFNGIGYLIGKQKTKSSVADIQKKEFTIANYDRIIIILVVFAVGIIPYFLLGVLTVGLSETINQVFAGRGDKAWAISGVEAYQGSIKMLLFWITRAFLIASAVLAGIYGLIGSTKWVRKAFYIAIFSIVFLIVSFDQGTRSLIIMTVVPVMFVFVLKTSLSGTKISRMRLIFIGLVPVFLLVTFTQYQRYYRLEHTRVVLEHISLLELISTREQTDFFTETAVAVEVRDNVIGYDLHESPLSFFVFNVIPRSIWPEKPVSETMWRYSLYRWDTDIWRTGGNALPSVVGQYYMNWGVIGVIWIGIFYGVVAAKAENLIIKESSYEALALGLSILTFMFVSFRFLSPGFHYPIVALALIYYGYKNISSKKSPQYNITPNNQHNLDSKSESLY